MTQKTPEMAPIDSSMFSHHHYDPNSRVFTVQFKNGAVHQYEDVPAEKNDAFLGNMSKGRYFNERIKPNHIGRKVSE
jgi:hypothetical protein